MKDSIKKDSNLYIQMKKKEQEIKDYIKKYARTNGFDPCYFGKLNTEYFNLRFEYDEIMDQANKI